MSISPWLAPLRRVPVRLSILLLAGSLAACTSSGGTDAAASDAAVPDTAYGLASDPLPTDAVEVSPAELAALGDAGAPSISRATELALEAAAARQEAEDDALIAAVEADAGIRLAPAPPTLDGQTTLLPGGEVLHSVTMSDGHASSIVTLSHRQLKHATAVALRDFPGRDNQAAVYSSIVATLPTQTLDQFGLIDSTTVQQYPTYYTASMLDGYNQRLVQNFRSLIAGYDLANGIPVTPACGADVGDGTGGDGALPDAGCGFRKNGLFASYPFPAQEHLTCVKDQRNRGTCEAFATVAAMEYAVHKKHGLYVNLSEQAYWNRIATVWDPRFYADGTSASPMLAKVESEGWRFPFENQWDYNPSASRITDVTDAGTPVGLHHSCDNYSETCSDTSGQGTLACNSAGRLRVCLLQTDDKNPSGKGYTPTSHAQVWDATRPDHSTVLILLAAIFSNPVIWTFSDTPSWDRPTQGVVSHVASETNRGGHAALIVGFITNDLLAQLSLPYQDPEGFGYFVVKNSWSSCFGDGGYLYVPYGFVKEYTSEAGILAGVQ